MIIGSNGGSRQIQLIGYGPEKVNQASFEKRTSGVLYIEDFDPIGDGITSDQSAIVNAVTEAYTRNMALMWGSKTYFSTDNIPNFHKVRHLGEGMIKRGENLFYISPKSDTRNKIYVNGSVGSNTFDGLSADQPVRQLYVAVNFLPNYGFALRGFWEFVLSEGTHDRRTEFPVGIISENPIEVSGFDVGVHPNIPLTIISEGIGIAAIGIKASNGTRIKVKNVKFIGFNGSTSSAGINVSERAKVYTENVHYDQCFYGVSGQAAEIIVPDGIIENCGKTNLGTGVGAGIRSLMGNVHTIGIQNAGNRDKTVIFRNNRYAFWAQEVSTGHVDWCTFIDNEDGVVLRSNSRANLDGSIFMRNQRGIRADSSSHVFLSLNTVFGTGIDANGYNVVRASGSQVTGTNFFEGIDVSRSITDSTFDIVFKNQTIATTSNTVFHTLNLLAPLWRNSPSNIALGKKLYFRIFGTLNGANSNKRLTVRLGNANLTCTFGASDSGSFEAYGYIYFTGANQQYMFMSAIRHLGSSPKQSRAIATNEMTINTTLTFEAQVDNTSDSVLIDLIEVGWAG